MRALLLALAVFLLSPAEARMPTYWTCTDAAGNKFFRDSPCPEPKSPAGVPSEAQQPAVESVPNQAEVSQSEARQRTPPSEQRRLAKPAATPKAPKTFASLFWILLLGALAIFVLKTWLVPARPRSHRSRSYTASKPFDRIEPSSDLLDMVLSKKASPAPVVERPTEWSIELIRKLEWKRFEELCEGYWRAKGYRAEPTGNGADGGVDVNIFAPSDPNQLFAVIQCKAWNKEVGVKEIRELWGVGNHLKVRLVMFYGLSGFTEEAKSFASNKYFKLFSGIDLLSQVQALSIDQQKELLDHVTRGDYTTPSCPQCDVKMELRQAKKGSHEGNKFWGCVNYPRCNQIINQRLAQ